MFARIALASLLAAAPLATAQSPDPLSAAAEWIQLPAAPGSEDQLFASLVRHLGPSWSIDRFGNLVKRVGSGTPRRVVACGLDIPSYTVSQITNGGYLRVRRTGNASHPLWDQFHEAQRITIVTRNGRVPGVVAVANGHFAQQHRADTVAATMDDLWIDIGASTAAEVARAGVAILDPLTIDRPAWTFGDFATGPGAGSRAGCAALVSAASGQVTSGETIFVITSQRSYQWLGLSRLLASLGRVQYLVLVNDGITEGTSPSAGRGGRGGGRGAGIPARGNNADSIQLIVPRVRYARSLVESIRQTELVSLRNQLIEAAGVVPSSVLSWIRTGVDTARALSRRAGIEGEIERQWMAIADLPGVAGHEQPVRAAIMAALPAWARSRAVVDSIGNIVVAMGPERDSVAYIAHMDEVGFEVASILPDGQVTLRTRGGVVIPSWEGTPALLHFDTEGPAPLRGVFVPRDSGRMRSPGSLTAWFGVDSAQLVAKGVREGLSLTSYKRADRLLGSRITGRASDDRTGSTALLFAIRRINPDSLNHKVFFVWSVQEEGGLNGARFFGDRHGANLKRVYSIDTFVSSDTPKETPHFAFVPLGNGAVLRGLDNASLVPRNDRDRIIRVARARGIPLQIGTTFGSTDGSAIQGWGPVNIGLSWPGRYSHGPAEVLDLRDVDALIRLIGALVADGPGR